MASQYHLTEHVNLRMSQRSISQKDIEGFLYQVK